MGWEGFSTNRMQAALLLILETLLAQAKNKRKRVKEDVFLLSLRFLSCVRMYMCCACNTRGFGATYACLKTVADTTYLVLALSILDGLGAA